MKKFGIICSKLCEKSKGFNEKLKDIEAKEKSN